MKSIHYAIILLCCIILALSSCEKHDSVYKGQKLTKDLVVPDSFDWSTTRAVTFSILSPSKTVASFYSDKLCNSESLIGVLPVPEGKTSYAFDLPYSQHAVFIQYPSIDGTIKTIEYKINKSQTKAVESDEIIFMEPFLSVSDFSLKIPYTGRYGTIMFEDTWPGTGDYDFNDVVVNYKINCELLHSNNSVSDILVHVSLKIRALGGKLPYDFGMQIGTWADSRGPKIPASDMVGVEAIQSADHNLNVETLDTEYPAVLITGLHTLRKENYYNTEKKEDDGVQISFTVRIKGTENQQVQRINSGLADPKGFDYFLRHQNGREIHMKGFAPTSLYLNQYDQEVVNGGEIYYQHSNRLVWGLKAPVEIGWPAERKDITGVYYRFIEWVESNGAVLEDSVNPLKWYNYYNSTNYIQN